MADVKISFQTNTSQNWFNNTWTVADADPVQTNVIPEPTSALSGLACLAPILGMIVGRRRKSVAAVA
jgi:hypothetical protein